MRCIVLLASVALALPSAWAQQGSNDGNATADSDQAMPQPFDAHEQALWIDRHNYFRLTALPYAAANMHRLAWQEALAAEAARRPELQCDASLSFASTKESGVNVYSAASATAVAAQQLVDDAFAVWAVDPLLAACSQLTAPRAQDGVGQGVYNSYSQIVWAATDAVGCAYAQCSGSHRVACIYAPAGNKPDQPWYIHGPSGSGCPATAPSHQGLCTAPGSAVDTAAALPAGQLAYNVYGGIIAQVQAAVQGQVDPATTVVPGEDATTPLPTTSSPSPSANNSSIAMAPTRKPKPTGSVVVVLPSPSPSNASPSATGSLSSSSHPPAMDPLSPVPSSVGPSTSAPVPAPGNEDEHTAGGKGDPEAKTEQPPPSPRSPQSVSASHQSQMDSQRGSGFSAAGYAGVGLMGAVAVAVIAVFVGYQRNRHKQQEIIQSGGLHAL